MRSGGYFSEKTGGLSRLGQGFPMTAGNEVADQGWATNLRAATSATADLKPVQSHLDMNSPIITPVRYYGYIFYTGRPLEIRPKWRTIKVN